ncbi:YmfL family putative regulatory protein [Pseudomonas protegens]|uniref:YmfL family putative regulatory protein n=1 Tax=Pseudomonas protegens TaxID=380021 RepID=UPI0039068D4B
MRRLSTENENAKHVLLDSRRKVISALINAYPGGRDGCAALLGLDIKKFDNQAYGSAGHRPLEDHQLCMLEQIIGSTFLPDYICGMYGGVFVPMPEAESLDNLALYTLALRADVKEGQLDQLIAKALEDGEIDESEIAEIVAAHREHVAACHAEVGAVITLHRKARSAPREQTPPKGDV